MKKTAILIIACYMLIYIVWGSTYYFIRLAVQTIPPFLVVGIRFFVAGAAILSICLGTGRMRRCPTYKELLVAVLMGTLLLLGGNALVTIAQKHIDSYIAALVIACTPLAVAALNRVLFGIRTSRMVNAGIILGVIGIATLLYDGKSMGAIFTPYVILILAGLTLWSLATCIGHRLHHYPDVFVSSGLQMLYVGIVCIGGQLLVQPAAFAALPASSTASIIGVIYLAVAGGIAFAAYNYLLLHEPAQRITSYALVNPAIAVLIGLCIGKETPRPYLAIGLPILFLGISLLLYGNMLVKIAPLPMRVKTILGCGGTNGCRES
jgi:drug/metabolite transporter (DMT)-like permease